MLRATLNGQLPPFMIAEEGSGGEGPPPSNRSEATSVKTMSQVRDFGTVDLKSGRYMLPADRKAGIIEKVQRGLRL